jgi:cytochrome c oxidase subunit 4
MSDPHASAISAEDVPVSRQESTFHIVPIGAYAIVFGLLVVGMVATILAAEYLHLPTLYMNIIAMGIAVGKASLVVLYFMGVKFTTQLAKIFAIGGFVWVTLLCIMFCDYGTRHDEPAPGWTKAPHSYQSDVLLPQLGKEVPRQYWGAH